MIKIVVLILLISNICLSQTGEQGISFRKITGQIIDESGKGYPGQNVMIKGTEIGTQTDINGNFCLVAPKNKSIFLEFSFCFEPILLEIKSSENKIEIQIGKGKRKYKKATIKWNNVNEKLSEELKNIYKSDEYSREKEFICN